MTCEPADRMQSSGRRNAVVSDDICKDKANVVCFSGVLFLRLRS